MANTKSKHAIEITAIDRASQTIKGIEGSFRNLGRFIGGSLVAGAFIKATDAAVKFESGLAKTATLLPPASRNMEQFAKGLERIRMSGVGGSLGELTEGLYQAVSASVDAGHAVEFLGVAARAAEAGFTDTRTAVDGLTGVLNAYRMSAEQAEHVADILFVTQNRGKTTFGELSSAMGRVLPLASSLGVSFEEIAASIQTLTLQNINTNEAVTGIRAILAGFVRQGDSAKVTSLGLSAALQELYNKTGGNTTKIQEYLGGVEAVTPALALMGENAKTLADNLIATQNASGTAKDAYNTFMDTASGRLKALQGSLEVVVTQFGQGISDALARTTDNMNKSGIFNEKTAQAAHNLGIAIGFIAENLAKVATFLIIEPRDAWRKILGLDQNKAFDPIANPLSNFVGPPRSQYSPPSIGEQTIIFKKNVADVNDGLKKVADAMRNWGASILGSRFGEGRAVIQPLGRDSQFGSGIGVRLGQSGGRLRGGLFDTQFNENTVPGREGFDMSKPNEALSQFQQRVQTVTSYTLSLTSSFTQAIVRGIEQGTLRIKDLFNALKSAVLQILADLAAKIAAAGILSILFPSTGFKGFLGPLTGGLFGGGSVNSFRPAPVGANPNAGGGAFGGGVHNHYYIQGSLVTREQIANEVIRIGTKAAQRGQNSLQVR